MCLTPVGFIIALPSTLARTELGWRTHRRYPFPTYLPAWLHLSSAVHPVGLAYCLVKHLTYKYCVWQEEKCFVYVIPF